MIPDSPAALPRNTAPWFKDVCRGEYIIKAIPKPTQ